MNLQVNIGLAVSNLLTFGLGVLIVWALWYRDRRRWAKAAKRLRSAVNNLVFDRRKNSLVRNIVERIERGKPAAQKDFELLDRLLNAAFGVCRAPVSNKAWRQYRSRALKATKAWAGEDGERL